MGGGSCGRWKKRDFSILSSFALVSCPDKGAAGETINLGRLPQAKFIILLAQAHVEDEPACHRADGLGPGQAVPGQAAERLGRVGQAHVADVQLPVGEHGVAAA